MEVNLSTNDLSIRRDGSLYTVTMSRDVFVTVLDQFPNFIISIVNSEAEDLPKAKGPGRPRKQPMLVDLKEADDARSDALLDPSP
jgi:hypothetical protein